MGIVINFDDVFDKNKLLKKCETLDFYDDENGGKEAIVEFISDCHNGTLIPKFVCEMFGLTECQDENKDGYWDNFQEVENEFNNNINKYLQFSDYINHDDSLDFVNYHFYFGYCDNGDYCLFAGYQEDDNNE